MERDCSDPGPYNTCMAYIPDLDLLDVLRSPGGLQAGQPRPTHPLTHIRKILLRQKMKCIKGAGNSRPILPPPPLYKLRQCTQLLQSLHLL